jgi:hypothetical protein
MVFIVFTGSSSWWAGGLSSLAFWKIGYGMILRKW